MGWRGRRQMVYDRRQHTTVRDERGEGRGDREPGREERGEGRGEREGGPHARPAEPDCVGCSVHAGWQVRAPWFARVRPTYSSSLSQTAITTVFRLIGASDGVWARAPLLRCGVGPGVCGYVQLYVSN